MQRGFGTSCRTASRLIRKVGSTARWFLSRNQSMTILTVVACLVNWPVEMHRIAYQVIARLHLWYLRLCCPSKVTSCCMTHWRSYEQATCLLLSVYLRPACWLYHARIAVHRGDSKSSCGDIVRWWTGSWWARPEDNLHDWHWRPNRHPRHQRPSVSWVTPPGFTVFKIRHTSPRMCLLSSFVCLSHTSGSKPVRFRAMVTVEHDMEKAW